MKNRPILIIPLPLDIDALISLLVQLAVDIGADTIVIHRGTIL
jgi:hypothetical protein